MLRGLREYLGQQEPAVVVTYAIVGLVCSVGLLITALLVLGVLDVSIGPDD